MLFSNLASVVLVGAGTSVLARVIRDPFPTTTNTNLIPPPPPFETCAFSLSHLSVDPSRIPLAAWSHITSLLLNHPLHTHLLSSSIRHNTMQTLDLASHTNDQSLSGIKLGLVFTTHGARDTDPRPSTSGHGGKTSNAGDDSGAARKPSAGEKQGESGSKSKSEKEYTGKEEVKRTDQDVDTELACLDIAIEKIGERRQMEGMMEFERGRISFLVYRVD